MPKYKHQIGLDTLKEVPHEVTHRIAWTSPGILLVVLWHMQFHYLPGDIKKAAYKDLDDRGLLCDADKAPWPSDGITKHVMGVMQDVLTFKKGFLWPYAMAVRANEHKYKDGFKEDYIYLLTETGKKVMRSDMGRERYNDSYSKGIAERTVKAYTHKMVEEALEQMPEEKALVEKLRRENNYVPD